LLNAVLLGEDDRKADAVYKLLKVLTWSCQSLPDDGGCDEGPDIGGRRLLFDNIAMPVQLE
jgi:hypothetical protein